MRPTWDDTMFAIAHTMAQRSTCPRLHTAAVICTPDHRIISTGYNGSLPGQPHCDEVLQLHSAGEVLEEVVGCELVGGHCIRTVHAEMNAILHAAKYGTPLQGTSMYILHRPCVQCAKAIVMAGIAEVHFYEPYDVHDDYDSAVQKLLEAGVVLR